MKDMFGKEIKVGDRVAYVEGGYSNRGGIQIQTVTGFKTVEKPEVTEYVLLTEEGAECQLGWRPRYHSKKAACLCFIVSQK